MIYVYKLSFNTVIFAVSSSSFMFTLSFFRALSGLHGHAGTLGYYPLNRPVVFKRAPPQTSNNCVLYTTGMGWLYLTEGASSNTIKNSQVEGIVCKAALKLAPSLNPSFTKQRLACYHLNTSLTQMTLKSNSTTTYEDYSVMWNAHICCGLVISGDF